MTHFREVTIDEIDTLVIGNKLASLQEAHLRAKYQALREGEFPSEMAVLDEMLGRQIVFGDWLDDVFLAHDICDPTTNEFMDPVLASQHLENAGFTVLQIVGLGDQVQTLPHKRLYIKITDRNIQTHRLLYVPPEA